MLFCDVVLHVSSEGEVNSHVNKMAAERKVVAVGESDGRLFLCKTNSKGQCFLCI